MVLQLQFYLRTQSQRTLLQGMRFFFQKYIYLSELPLCTVTKEYISLTEEALSQPLSACTDGSYTDGQVVQYTASGERLGECFP